MTVRVGIIDSGIHAGHPHVGEVSGGVFLHSQGESQDYIDRIGHGTAVAGTIREKVPNAELYAVRIFERRLSANIEILVRALDWCFDGGMSLVNLSVGTSNPEHRAAFEHCLRRAASQQVLIVSAAKMLPGSLDGVVGVKADPESRRESCRFEKGVFYASPYPRAIPGVSRERNLSGVSFAIANCSGMLAALLQSLPAQQAVGELQRMSSSSSPFRR